MTQPLREDFPIYDLPSEKVIDGPWPAAQTPGAVLSNPDALAPKKPKAKRKKKATGKKRGRPAKQPTPDPVPESPPANLALSMNRVAPAGDGIVSRFPKLHADDWRLLACLVGVAAVVASVALVIFW